MTGVRTRWECEAALDRGDHGMGAQRPGDHRIGLIEVTDALRWVPRQGLEWSLPVAELTVTAAPRWRGLRHGVEVRHRAHGTLRIRPMRGSRQARRLARELVARGAALKEAAPR